MLKKLLISVACLLIVFTLTTFDGLTQYPLSDLQMRKTVRLKIEYTSLLEQNMNLTQMIVWCDSVMNTQVVVIEQMDGLLIIKGEKIINLKLQNEQAFGMFDSVNDQVKKERRLKYIFMGATVLMAGFLTLSLL